MTHNFFEEFTPDGVTNVGGGKRVIYEDIYEDIDYHILSNVLGPKFLIVVRPGGDPGDIVLRIDGADSIKVDIDGFLKLWFGQKFVKLAEGYAYQQDGGAVNLLPWMAHYDNAAPSHIVTLELSSYDPALPLILVITPNGGMPPPPPPINQPEWSTYMPGTANDGLLDLTHDGDGNVYFTGYSLSGAGSLPITTGIFQDFPGGGGDMIVGKFNEHYEIEVAGTWMTYTGGSGPDEGTSIAYDALNDRVVFCGRAFSSVSTLPNVALLTNPTCYANTGLGLLSFLDAGTGELQYRSHLYHDVQPMGIDVDASGNVYVGGYFFASSFDYEDVTGAVDYFSMAGPQSGFLFHEGFVMKFDSQANLLWSTGLGGPKDDRIRDLHVDRTNNRLYLVGDTYSPNDPGTVDCSNGQGELPLCDFGGWYQWFCNGTFNGDTHSDGFIVGIDLNDLHVFLGTYFGGGGDDLITSIATDNIGNLFFTGNTYTGSYNVLQCDWDGIEQSFPVCDNGNYFQPGSGGAGDNFIARLDNNTQMTWCTKVDGNKQEPLGGLYSRPRVTCDDDDNVILFSQTQSGSDLCPPGAPGYDPLTMLPDPAEYYDQGCNADFTGGSPGDPLETYFGVFRNDGELLTSGYFGGKGNDRVGGVAAFNDRLYVCGETWSPVLFPLHDPAITGFEFYEPVPSANPAESDGYIAQIRFSLFASMDEAVDPATDAMLLYPSPTLGFVTLIDEEGLRGKRVLVLNALGLEVLTATGGNSRQMDLDLRGLAPGLYVIGLVDANSGKWARMVKQ